MSTRWTDEFLNGLRKETDPAADETVRKMIADGEIKDVKELFRHLNSNDDTPPEKIFPVLNDFCEETKDLPHGTDRDRIRRGEDLFMEYGLAAVIILLAKSLMEGYAAPTLTRILNMSENLEHHPYHRLLAVLQMVINVCAYRGFESRGKAVITAQKVRLLHAGVRHIAADYLPDYPQKYNGEYVNHEDMLATLMGFSYLVIEGWRQLGYHIPRHREDDYLYLWTVYGVMMGIHPPGEPHSFAYMPDCVDDAKAFYDTYARRHYTGPKENPDGVKLAQANLDMMFDMVPWLLIPAGFGLAPRIYTQHFIGRKGCRRIGIWPLPAFYLMKFFFWNLPRMLSLITRPIYKIDRYFHRTKHDPLIQIMLQTLINHEFVKGVHFTIPVTMKELREL